MDKRGMEALLNKLGRFMIPLLINIHIHIPRLFVKL